MRSGESPAASGPADAIPTLEELVDLGDLSYWETDAEMRYTLNVSGPNSGNRLPDSQFVGRTRWEIAGVDPDRDPQWREHHALLMARRPFRNFSLAIPHGPKKFVHWLSSGDPRFDGQGVFIGYRGVSRNVTDLVGAVEEAQQGREMIESIVAHLPSMIFRRRVDRDGTLSYDFLRVHPDIAESFGLSDDSTTASDVMGAMAAADRDRFLALLERSRRTLTPMEFEYRSAVAGRGEAWMRSISVPRLLSNGDTVWDGIGLEITEHRALSERLDYLSLHDEETGLPNRRSFVDHLRQALRGNRRVQGRTVLIVARLVPERLAVALGASAYRSLLRLLAARIGEMNSVVSFTARLTDDQFALCLYPREDDDEIVEATRRVAEQLTAAVSIDGEPVLPPFHIGAAVHPVDAQDAEALVDRAVAAAATGRHLNEVTFFSRDLETRISGAYRLETELRAALERGAILPHYQPIASLADGSLIGAEALARWHHPERGLLSAAAFIDEAEHSDMVVMLDTMMIEQVCADIARWRAQGRTPPPISVNVSALSIETRDFEPRIREALQRHDLDTEALRLEVTETSVLALEPAVLDAVASLQRAGVGIAIDDFGTGYSTLATFVALPADSVKIDKSFVEDIGRLAESVVVIEAVCAMAHAVGRRVVAEGVERLEQRVILADLGCDAFQGFLAGSAMPGESFIVLF